MPSWRKVILSGSNATLNSLNVTTSITASTVSASSGFTGSLFGTSSWARNTVTASFLTPLTQSVIVSGSIAVTGSVTVGDYNLVNPVSLFNGWVPNTIGTPLIQPFVVKSINYPVRLYNHFANLGDNRFFDSVGNNRFHGRSDLIGVSVNGGSFSNTTYARLFNGDYDEFNVLQLSYNDSASVKIDLNRYGYAGVNGITYPQGQIHALFYDVHGPLSMSIEYYTTSSVSGLVTSSIFQFTPYDYINQGYPVPSNNYFNSWRVDVPQTNGLIGFTLFITASSGIQTYFSELEYLGSRIDYNGGGNFSREGGYVKNINVRNNATISGSLIVSSSAIVTGSLNVSSSAIIIGSLAVGTSSLGSTENTIVVGLPPAASPGGDEGGQILLQAPGGTYTSASMLDNYQNRFRVLRGTNASSNAEFFSINLHNGQLIANKYTGSGAFPGTTAAFLAVDTAGNIITAGGTGTTPGGSSTQIQYNNGGAFGGVPVLTYDGTTLRATGSFTGSFTGSLFGTASWANNTNTASLATRNLLTASVSLNTITFTKGDGSTFPITVDTGSGGTSFTGLEYQVAYFVSTNGTPEGADYITAYPSHVEGVALRVGKNAPTVTSPSGSHILKDNRELFTNAKGVESNEPFVILGFGGKNNVDLTATDTYEHPGVDGYSDFTSSKVYNGSLKLAKSLYGLTEANTGKTQLYTDGGIIVKPTSPGFLVGQGGFYIFDSASMQFNTSGSLISPVASASVRLTLATDSSSLSIAVGKNSLTDILYISRSGNDARIAIGGDYRTPKNTLDISGSLRVFTSITASTISASGGITGSDLNIKGFPSVSASLASLASGVGTLQQVTDAGNTTSNAISSSFSGVGFYGTASWAINVVNGGGGGGGGSDSAFLNQSTAATTWSFTHNLGTQYPVITVYDTNGQVIIPQEIDGEDTNNLKIYFPTSQSGYATAVGGTSALTYYSQSLTTASVNLNTITFTKGDSSTFPIVVNTFPYTGSAIISGSLTITGSTAITGGFEALGIKGSKIQLGTYNVGYDVIGVDAFYITGAGLIISGNMPDQNHHNLLKIGNVEMVDVNTALTTNEFLIHNVNTLRITSGADGGNITTNNQLLKIGGGSFYVYRAGSGDSSGIIQSTANYTTISDTFITLYGLSGSYFNIPSTNEITTLNGTDYLMGFVADPAPTPGLSYKVKASKFIWATGSNQIISGGLTITGSTFISGGLSTQYIDFDINAVPAFQTGRVNWVDDTKTLAIDTELNGFQIEVGHQNIIRVRNETGATILRGRAVYLSGSSGNRPLIYTSSYEIDPTSAGTVGLVAADIGSSNNGYVISNGLIRDVNTTTFAAGAVLYLSSSGQLSTTAPVAPLHGVRMGKVITSATSGIIHVDIDNGYEIGELHDVVDNTTNTTYGSLLVKSGSVWKDGYQLTGSYGLTGSLNATSFTGSLLGTASWANNSITSSYILNAVSSSFALTSSLAGRNLLTASVSLNTITFTKGDGSTFNITVDTGSGGGGGSVGTLAQVTALGASTTVPITASIISASSFTGSLFGTASWALNVVGGGGSGTPGGANTTIQFNDSSNFSGSGNFTFNKTTNAVILTGSLNISSSGTALQIVGSTGSVLLSVSGSVPNIFSISNSGSARLATFTQTTNNHGILLVGSESYQPANGSSATDGVIFLLGVNRSGNRQLWIGDSTAAGSATNGFFRFQTGTPLPSLDATSGTGNRLNVNIATPTTNAGVGYEYGTGAATGTTLPPSRLSVNGGLTVASGSSFTASTAPVGGAIIQGNTLIGTATNSTFRLDVSGAVRLQTGLSTTGSTVLSGSISTVGTTSMTGSLIVSTNITASRTFLSGSVGTVSGSTLTVYGSGSAQPVFTVQGSSGELFSVTDSLTGSLFSVNDISGLPILEVFSDNSVLIGSYLDPMLVSTAKVTQTNSGSFVVYSLPTASYDTAFFEYSVRSGSNARVGTIMAIQSASSVNFMETTASQFGSTSAISFTVVITGSNMALTGSSTTGSWTIKTIVRGI